MRWNTVKSRQIWCFKNSYTKSMWLSWEIWQSQIWAFKRRHKLHPRQQTAIHSPETRRCGWVTRALLNILPLFTVHAHHLGDAVTISFSVLHMIQSSFQCQCPSGELQHIFSFVRKPEEQSGHWTHVSHHPAPAFQLWYRNGNKLLHTLHAVLPSRTRADEYADACRRIW